MRIVRLVGTCSRRQSLLLDHNECQVEGIATDEDEQNEFKNSHPTLGVSSARCILSYAVFTSMHIQPFLRLVHLSARITIITMAMK
jgi:hypothetical protein